MMTSKIRAWVTSVFIVYSLCVYALLFTLNLSIPRWLENVITILAIPIFGLIAPWMDLLRNIGLTEGEWIRMPTFTGYLLIIFLYATAFYMFWGFIVLIKRRFW